jgi:hypothetical protein
LELSTGEKLVPIFRIRREWPRGTVTCARTQFPLVLAYAITIHKSQSASLDQAVLNISQRDFALGLTYVAISRVRSLDGLIFEEPFGFDRLVPDKNATWHMREDDRRARGMQQLVSVDDIVQSTLARTVDLPYRPSSPVVPSSSLPKSDVYGSEFAFEDLPAGAWE